MSRKAILVVSAAVLIGSAIACTSSEAPLAPAAPTSTTPLPADGSTLKVTAPVPQSPINDQRLTDPAPPTLRAAASSATFGAAVPLQYRFQIFNDTGALVVDSGVVNSSTWASTRDLDFDKRHTWQARAESQGNPGPWSARASFRTAEGAFIRGSQVFDPLTTGRTVGHQIGGHFVPGQGWQADSLTDGIDYDIATCSSCIVEFDATGFGKKEGEPFLKDIKWLTMGDAGAFGDFNSFRNHPWKMHLEQRSDGDGTGMKLIWRNGDAGEGEPGDHTGKADPAVDWRSNEVYHFRLEWNPSGFTVAVNGQVWFQDGFGGNAYAPPSHRISLGCYPRGETMFGIYRNVKVTPK